MILRSDGTTYTRQCYGRDEDGVLCGHEETSAIADLQAGNGIDPNIVVLPPCSICGGVTSLNRTFSDHASDVHQWTNALHAHLKAAGRIHAAHTLELELETETPRHTRALDTAGVNMTTRVRHHKDPI